jgi:hypothetical protein
MIFTRLAVIVLIVCSFINPSMWLWTIIAFLIVELDVILMKGYIEKIKSKPVEIVKFKESPEQQNKINDLESKLNITRSSVQGQLAAQASEITKLVNKNASLSVLTEKQKLEIEELRKINEPS